MGPTEIAPDGSFSFEVTNLTAPFYLQAEGAVGGQSYKLHSYAASDGTANINPLTDLAVAAAARVNDPAEVFSNPLTNPITSDSLAKAIADIQTMLQPLLTAYSASADFLSGDYKANHTGLDGMLDIVEVSINTANGEVVINDKIQNEQLAAMTTTTIVQPTDAISSTEATKSVNVTTDLQEIASFLSMFATELNKGPILTIADLEPYYATDFGLDDGRNRTQSINETLENMSDCINCISSISGVAIKEKKDNDDYIITAVPHMSDGIIYTNMEWTVTNSEDDTWKFKGNSYKSDITEVAPHLGKYVDSNGSASFITGIRFDIEDPGNLDLQSAIITGPGLPVGGIEMAKESTGIVGMDPVNWADYKWEFYHVYPLSDATIEAMPEANLTYTIVIKDTTEADVETRTVTLPKRPFKLSEMTSDHFIKVSGIPNHNTSSLQLGGKTLSFTYAKPIAYQVAGMNIEVGYSASSGWDVTEKGLSPNETSGSIVTLGLPEGSVVGGGWLRADVWDMYGRDVFVEWQFSPTSSTPFEGSQPPVESPAIVGTWYGGNTASRPIYVMTFFADGTYIMADDDDSSTNTDPNNPICQPGIEHGTYTWKPDTGAFSAKPTLTDTNGECGFSTGDDSPATANVTISGDIMTQDMGDSGGVNQLTRLVPDSGNPIVGTWYAGNPGSRDGFSVGIFFEDSTYVIADDGAQAGMEHGAYTWDPATGAFTASASLADSNGDWGFNNTSSADNVTATISGDTLTHTYPGEGVHTATRLVP